MELPTESARLKTVKKYIQDNGGAIKDTETGKKFTKTNDIDIKANSSTTNIMVVEYYRTKITRILVISLKAFSMEMEWLDIRMDSSLLGDLE